MKEIDKIITAIDTLLENNKQEYTTPVKANKYLESIGLLSDSFSRPGLPLRQLLRNDEIKHAYQIGTSWRIPHSSVFNGINHTLPLYQKVLTDPELENKPKLYIIALFFVDLLEKEFKIRPEFSFEYKPEWLLSYPSDETIEKYREIEGLYSEIVENRYNLKDIINKISDKNKSQKQSYDIWINEPFNFAIEFDEEQHFNQFRFATFKYYKKIKVGFPIELYESLNKNIFIKPSKTGFTKLKNPDPLFPELLDSEVQDNRIRQRAFRDFLKDLLPVQNGFKPTIRILYQVTNKKINKFTEKELLNIERYLINNKILDQFKIK